MPADLADDEWVEVTLFYVTVPRLEGDPDTVRSRAEVIYGEGAVTAPPDAPRLRTEKLGEGLRVLRMTNQVTALTDVLQREAFDHRDERFIFGLLRRPPVAGLAMPRPSGVLDAPVVDAYHFVQFIRIDKLGLLQRASCKQQADDSSRAFIDGLLGALATRTGCDLRGDHLQWLGDVVIAHRVKSPVQWSSIPSNDGRGPRALDVLVAPGVQGTVHAQLRITGTDGMCLGDRLLQWQPGETASQRIALSQEISGVFLRVWVNSELVLEEQRVILRGFMGTVEMAGSSWTIQDRLTQKLAAAVRGAAADGDLLTSAQKGQSTAMSTKVGSQLPPEPWTGLNRTAQVVSDYVRPRAPDYAYFPKGAAGRTRAILHFAGLVSKAEQAYLVDPWFDATGAEALLPRVRGEVRFTVVTNLPSAQHAEHRKALDTFLHSAAVMGLPEHLQILCVCSSRPEVQFFHDRFLLLKKAGDGWRGFVLTNSFSGLATAYSLFVVEAEAGTTALLLAELEQLLDSCSGRGERVWPPERKQPRSPELGGDRGQFPYWRTLLRTIVHRWRGTDRAWLLAAEARGFLVLKEDGMKWLMTPKARLATLEVLLGARAVERRTHSRWLRRRNARHKTERNKLARLPIGRATLILGELAARGFDIDANRIAACLGRKDAMGIEQALRSSFDDDPDPVVLRPGGSQERMRLRQSLRKDVSLAEAAWTGLSLWNSRVFPRSRTSYWDRCFTYAVLAYLDPPRAIRLSEELLDADFVLALVGTLHRRVKVWSEQLARALICSKAPVLRALGAQALSHSSFEGQGEDTAPSSSDGPRTLDEVRSAGWNDAEVVYLLCVWGIDSEDRTRTDIANELARVLGSLDTIALPGACKFLFEDEVRSLSFLERVIDALVCLRDDKSTTALEALIQCFAQRFHTHQSDFRFSEAMHLPLTAVIARATASLATRHQTSPTLEIQRIARTAELEREFGRLTPFRWRKGAATADVALGWTVLWDLVSSSTPAAAGVTVPEAVVQRAKSYLQRPCLRQSSELRECLRRVLGPTVAGTQVDEDELEDE